MSFGWSAGDIVVGLKLVFQLSKALSESRGSVKDHHEAEVFCKSFKYTIYIISTATEQGKALDVDDAASTAIRINLEILKQFFDELRATVEKNAGLQAVKNEDAGDYIERQVKKVKWEFFAKDAVRELREKMAQQTNLLLPLLFGQQQAVDTTQILTSIESMKDLIISLHKGFLPSIGPEQGVAATATSCPDYSMALSKISPYVERIMSAELTNSLRNLKVDFKLLYTFREWLDQSQKPTNNRLWLLGKSASKLSAILYTTGRSAKLPIITFHCTQLDMDGYSMTSEDLLKNMVYAFLYQLLELLQEMPGARRAVDGPAMAELADRSRVSIPQAITLFERLLDNLPCECICIIDGFQRLESTGGQRRENDLKRLIASFERQDEAIDANSNTNKHKLLVTTLGWTEMLTDLSSSGRIAQQPSDAHIKSGEGLHVLSRELGALLGANARVNFPS